MYSGILMNFRHIINGVNYGVVNFLRCFLGRFLGVSWAELPKKMLSQMLLQPHSSNFSGVSLVFLLFYPPHIYINTPSNSIMSISRLFLDTF